MHYYTGERLSGANQIYCNNCKNLADAIIVNKIFTSPEVLTIILNRGKGLEFKVAFSFQYYIDINNFIVDKSSGKNNTYELIGILCHFGPSGMSGHFIAYCKSPKDNNWYCYNDATVVQCKGLPDIGTNANVDGIPYVLYYQRINNNNQNAKNFNLNINNNNNIRNDILNDNNKMNISKNENDDKISLNFKYKDKEYKRQFEKTKKIEKVIKKLHEKFNIPKKVALLNEKNNMDLLEIDKTINDYNLQDDSTLVVIDI